jgi:hypothetical protein
MLDLQFNIEFLYQTLREQLLMWDPGRLDLSPFTRLGAGGPSYIISGCFRSGSCGWTCFGTSTLWSESSIWKRRWCIRPTRHVQDRHYCKKPGHMIADSRKRQNANSRRQSDTAHLAAPPGTPTESETFQSPYSIGPPQHYFYDLRSTPTPDI